MTIFSIFLPNSPNAIHFYPLQIDSNWRLVVDGDDNGKFRLEKVKLIVESMIVSSFCISPSNKKM